MRPFLSCLAASLVVTILLGCSRESTGSTALIPPPPVQVQIAPVQREVSPGFVEIPGVVRPVERATIAAKISGTIDSLPIILGQTVRRGDLLARVAAPELNARLAYNRAQLDQAEREEKRDRALAATGADTADAARASVERLQAARAAVAEAEAMLAYTEIRAPYDGRIAQKLAYPGDFAVPGSALLSLERSPSLQIETAVPASLAPTLTLGAELAVQISGLTQPTIGRVAEIASAADAATHTVLAKLDLPAPQPSWSGRAVRVQLSGDASEALLVPTACVSRFGQMERVFVLAAGKAQLRLVRTGAVRGDRIELLSGVTSGENIVVAPPDNLRDGQPIAITP